MHISAKYWLTTYFVFFFFIWGIFLPFWGIWLADKGVSPEQIGTLFSLGLLLRFASNLGLLPRLKTANAPLQLISYLSFSIFLCLLVLVYFQGWYALAALTLLLNFLMAPMVPLGDIVGTRLVKQIQINYGQVRLWGSVSFIVGSTFIGWTITEYGHESILWLMIVASFCIYCLSLIKLNPQLQEQDDNSKGNNRGLFLLLKQPSVIYFLLIVGLIQGSHAAYYAFSALYWDSMGISEFDIALFWGMGVCAEVLLMRFNDKWFKRWSIKQMILLALIAGIIRWGVLSQTTDFTLLMLLQTFHAFTFALAHLAAMRFIALQSDHLMVGYQTLYSSVALGLMMALLTFLSGWIYIPQQSTIFLWMVIILLPVFIFLKKWRVE
ncbi:3-phenylpropionate MFS transporter [Psychromonas sp. RZ22]|uniref:3-phenylpropionate MFS transporter n=1 Tax=Psychromonas algarum TaxID=2555643 RepID=UPI001067910E|nr:3-phenylpropionate MFS transporter [Psychromonas sp. RZ22]TEW53458.1 3-phenylpropionate MFS transporter [Psychromonas sp. RZ22]